MTGATKLAALMTPRVGSHLPVRAWDGSEAGPSDAPVLHITSRKALRRLLWQPDELGIAQAYITGEVEVPGGARELADGLRRVWQHARVTEAGPIHLTARPQTTHHVL